MESSTPREPSYGLALSPRWLRKCSWEIFTGSLLLHASGIPHMDCLIIKMSKVISWKFFTDSGLLASWIPHVNCLLSQMAKGLVHECLPWAVKAFTPYEASCGPWPLPAWLRQGSTMASTGIGAFHLSWSLVWTMYVDIVLGTNVRVPIKAA